MVVAARRERRERKTDPQVARRAVDFGVMIVTGTMARGSCPLALFTEAMGHDLEAMFACGNEP